MKKFIDIIKERVISSITTVGISMIKKKSPILKEVLENPEGLKLEAHIEHDEIIVRIKKIGS